MSPPTEQLVRDYLNRLSVAARSRLSLRERQVLLDRTRTRIEAECGGVADASPARVRQVLANLGDPIGLVDAEYAADPQLAGVAPGAAAMANGSVAHLGIGAATPNGNGLSNGSAARAGMAGLPAGTVLASAGHAGAPAPSGDAGSGEPAVGPVPAVPSAGQGAAEVPAAGSGGTDGPARVPPVPAPRPASPAESAAPDAEVAAPEVAVPEVAAHEALDDTGPIETAAAQEPAGDEPAQEPNRVAEAADAAISYVSRLAREWFIVAQRHKLEMVAVLVIGVGGVLFPPVWLLGAVIAIPSKVWDLRDKWVSLGLPILVVLIGTVLDVVLGGQRASLGSYGHEAWLALGRISRVMAVAGAVYLLWRLRLGRRPPRLPPWKTPKKFDL